MADDNNGNNTPPADPDDPNAPRPMPFAIVSFHKVVEVPNHGQRLMAAFQLQGPGQVPLSHLFEVPGEVLPLIVQSIEQLLAEFPALTKDLCIQGETRPMGADEANAMMRAQQPSGLVDSSGKPIKNVSPGLKVVKH